MALHLLIVDDEWLDREGLRDQIARMKRPNLALHTARSGAEALRLMEITPIDILMTDIRMPQMTGLALAERAREMRPQLSVAFVSGYDDFAYAQRAIQAQAVWYLLKPVQDDELCQALDRAVAQAERAQCPAPAAPPQALAESTHEERLCAAVDQYLAARLGQSVTLIQIAQEMHYTPNYLGRLFLETRGITFSSHLQKMRMRAAKRLLREQPTLRIREVSRLVGYTNAEAFSRAFYQENGVSPLVFRNTVQP